MTLDEAIEAPEAITIGWWHTFCCHLDIEQIHTEEERERVRQAVLDGYDQFDVRYVWPTYEEAIADACRLGWLEQEEEDRR